MATKAAAVAATGTRARARARGSFFLWVSVLLLAFLVVGFTPTLYMRPAFDVQPIPGYLYVHGTVLTAWFVWLVLQTSMVRFGRTATHRKLGIAGVVLAVAVCFAGPMASVGVASRIAGLGVDLDSDISAVAPQLGIQGVTVVRFVSMVFWNNITSILVFAAFVATAVVLRRDLDTHKRLMLALLAALLLHDVVVRRRPHPVSVIGVGVLMLLGMVATRIAASEFGVSLVRSLV